jgi:hypothetical protein
MEQGNTFMSLLISFLDYTVEEGRRKSGGTENEWKTSVSAQC